MGGPERESDVHKVTQPCHGRRLDSRVSGSFDCVWLTVGEGAVRGASCPPTVIKKGTVREKRISRTLRSLIKWKFSRLRTLRLPRPGKPHLLCILIGHFGWPVPNYNLNNSNYCNRKAFKESHEWEVQRLRVVSSHPRRNEGFFEQAPGSGSLSVQVHGGGLGTAAPERLRLDPGEQGMKTHPLRSWRF